LADPSATPLPAFRLQPTCELVRDVRIASSSESVLLTHQFGYRAKVNAGHHQTACDLCRKQYQVKKLMPARRTAVSNQCL
jgi:hypothetical protein